MKKISTAVAGLMLASSSMMAMDIQYFLGAGAEFSNTKIENSDGDTFKAKDTAFKLKSEIILDKTHRISLSYSKPSDKDTWDDSGTPVTTKANVTLILANYDYFFPVTEDFRLGIGSRLDSAKLELKEEGEKWNKSGLAYGPQLSAIYDITKNVEFDVGYGHTRYNVDLKFDDESKEELKHTNYLYTGINFKF